MQAEHPIRQRRLELLQYAMDHCSDAMYWVRLDGQLLDVNRAACDITGYRDDELIAMSIFDVDPTLSPRRHQRITQQVRQLGSLTFETVVRTKSGETIPVEVNTTIQTIDDQEIFFSVLRDIRDRKQLELEHKKLTDQLAHLDRLHSIEKMTTALAHELNQPLTALTTDAFSLQLSTHDCEAVRTSELLELSNRIGEQAHRAGAIVQQMRSFSRKSESVRRDEEVNQIVELTCHLLNMQLIQDQVTLVKQYWPTQLFVLADKIQIQQIIVNVIRNGVEAMQSLPPEKRALHIRTELRFDRACVTIDDAGCGQPIDDEQLAQIFEPFYTSKPQGLGLGLSISRSLAEQHGGTLTASRNDQGGLSAELSLPCVEANASRQS